MNLDIDCICQDDSQHFTIYVSQKCLTEIYIYRDSSQQQKQITATATATARLMTLHRCSYYFKYGHGAMQCCKAMADRGNNQNGQLQKLQ